MDFFLKGFLSKAYVVVFMGLLFVQTTWAQSLEEQRLKSRQKFNYLNDMTVDSNAQDFGSLDNNRGVTYTLGIKYSPESIKGANFWLIPRLSKRFNNEEILGLLDTIVRFEKTLDSFLGFSQRLRLDATLPTNEFVHEQTSFAGAGSVGLRWGRSISPSLYLIWSNTLRWNFHQYRVSELGIVNIQSTFSSFGNLTYTVSPKLMLGTEFGWSWAKTYQNNYRNNYLLGGFASYIITPALSTTIGVSTFSSPFMADGQNSNIRLFDERETTLYMSLTHFM